MSKICKSQADALGVVLKERGGWKSIHTGATTATSREMVGLLKCAFTEAIDDEWSSDTGEMLRLDSHVEEAYVIDSQLDLTMYASGGLLLTTAPELTEALNTLHRGLLYLYNELAEVQDG